MREWLGCLVLIWIKGMVSMVTELGSGVLYGTACVRVSGGWAQ